MDLTGSGSRPGAGDGINCVEFSGYTRGLDNL